MRKILVCRISVPVNSALNGPVWSENERLARSVIEVDVPGPTRAVLLNMVRLRDCAETSAHKMSTSATMMPRRPMACVYRQVWQLPVVHDYSVRPFVPSESGTRSRPCQEAMPCQLCCFRTSSFSISFHFYIIIIFYVSNY